MKGLFRNCNTQMTHHTNGGVEDATSQHLTLPPKSPDKLKCKRASAISGTSGGSSKVSAIGMFNHNRYGKAASSKTNPLSKTLYRFKETSGMSNNQNKL